MGNPVTHFEVVGKDAAALQKFYGAAFGWKMKQQLPTYAMALPGVEGGISGGVGAAMDGGAGHVTFYVEVSDVAGALKTVEDLGGKTAMAAMKIPGGPTIGMFHDPEGHLVGLAERRGGRA